MARIAVGIEYNGAPYCGWQYQDHSPSVQVEVEKALGKVANHALRVVCAGRTDTGVHATEQVIHFDTTVERNEHSWVFGANANLPDSISVLWAVPVSDEFHARFSAVRRRYRYVIINRRIRPALLSQRAVWEYRPLDEKRMQAAADYLKGEHDFSSYRALACQAKSPVRTLYQLDVSRQGELVFLDLEANAFLHHMVRNIAGVLMTIGAGEKPPEWAKEVLELRDRTLGGVTAPPGGLYLTGVDYPEQFDLPHLSLLPVVW
ncbi:MAG: tRNA pseudouridine(38-40) synthase TruA [Gammaproteobacteria bacterium]|nr:tRNA pseudouridine(38-40) synthase TruA [Gammaproteobacteria bacterium]MDH5650807.1 tRNA pseudouridine(38-40) synthase TruA [Gammaproteobacteria bacterium]